jgi:glycosyltransferase involved in cell wall biosynthesis
MKVSICLITYNHEAYIQEALESVLMQVTEFPKEIVIGEDCSTDRTRAICSEYAEKYPDLIRLIPAEKNIGAMKNFLRTLKECTGKYIAFIEGDDYWTDPLKLQKQVDFLEVNSEYSACFHNVIIKNQRINEINDRVMHGNGLAKDSFDTGDVLGPWFIASPSFVFVNYTDFVFPDWFVHCVYGDLPFMLLLSLRGKFKYINEVMGIYRLHDTGMSAVHKAYDKIMVMVYIYASFDIHTNYKYHEAIRNAVMYEVDRHVPKKEITSGKRKQDDLITSFLKKVYYRARYIFKKEVKSVELM